LGLPPVEIENGDIANLTIFNPNKKWKVDKNKFKSKGRNTPFDNVQFIGCPEYTFNDGKSFKCEL
jgi:dihydroorotase